MALRSPYVPLPDLAGRCPSMSAPGPAGDEVAGAVPSLRPEHSGCGRKSADVDNCKTWRLAGPSDQPLAGVPSDPAPGCRSKALGKAQFRGLRLILSCNRGAFGRVQDELLLEHPEVLPSRGKIRPRLPVRKGPHRRLSDPRLASQAPASAACGPDHHDRALLLDPLRRRRHPFSPAVM